MADNEPQNQGLLGQREALVDVANALRELLPEENDGIVCEALVFADYGEYRPRLVAGDGSERRVNASYPLTKAVGNLRRIMHDPNTGTWYKAKFHYSRPGRMATDFDYDNEPDWTVAPTAETYADDLAKFPRSDEHVPAWMRDKLA